MLIEFSYGARDFKQWYINTSSTHVPDTQEIFQNWGERHSDSSNFSKQLINISNALIFSTITTGLPENCFLYYDIKDKKMYFTSDIHNIYSFKHGSHGYSRSMRVALPQDAFDWGDNYESKRSDFCQVVPDECFEDFLEEVLPYYEYDFTKKLLNMCNSSFNYLQAPSDAGSMSVPRVVSNKSPEKQEPFKLICDSVFWDVLVYDMFHGKLFKDFSTKYPRTVRDLLSTLNGLQNHYLTYDNIEYDPRNQPQ